ncbi:unnamed protein product [Adineta steineri]|uniref:Uncharacterized protein n=2 Tax=Adineta steineri TaxID=433720 RepID=A0A814FSZ8_9BILA|nr:unnamed protein product [Adineta steineri]
MAIASNKTQCFTCNIYKITYLCKGCLKEFCLPHLNEHQQIFNDELNHITNEYNAFKQTINEQKQNPQTFINDIEKKLNDLSEQIKQIHKENESNEINLNYLKKQLRKMTQELHNPTHISIQQNSQSFINEISEKPNVITGTGRNGKGQELNQLSFPYGIFVDEKKNIFIADYANHRIIEWKYNTKKGKIIAGGNGQGNQIDQLNEPKVVIIDQQNHSIIIADSENRRVIQWLNQKQQILINNIDCVGLAIDKHGFLYVSDWYNNEVRRWKMGEYNNKGIVVAGGNGKGY